MDEPFQPGGIPSSCRVGTPGLAQQLEFPEKRFSLRGGPDDPQKREALYGEFRLLAQEAEAFVSEGSSLPTSTVDDWLNRIRSWECLKSGKDPEGQPVRHLLTTSANHLKEVRVNEVRVRNQKRANGVHLLDVDQLAALAARFEALREKYFNAPFGGEEFSAIPQELMGREQVQKADEAQPAPDLVQETILPEQSIANKLARLRSANEQRLEANQWATDSVAWFFPNLSADLQGKIKARLLFSAAKCYQSPQLSASPDCMQEAFDGIAQVLFDAGILRAEALLKIPLQVWEAAHRGGWFFLTQETLAEFAKQRGHDGTWSDQEALFRPQTTYWQGRILQRPAAAQVPPSSTDTIDPALHRPTTGESASNGDHSELSPVVSETEVPTQLTETGGQDNASSGAPDLTRPRRTPDLQTSRERLQLVTKLARELAIVKQETKTYCTADELKQKYPQVTLWTLLEKAQVQELVEGASFTPKAYAENLTLAKYGLTSRETLKKDRRKLRNAKKPDLP